jgi:thioredoxin reductase (NADPH)
MKLPYIIIVDDDTQVLRAIQRDIRNKYREEYRIAATESAKEALEMIRELKLKNETVALFISDQRMPEMEGVAFLEKAKEIFPESKQVLLTAYSDIDAAIKAINTVKLDFYLQKPWNPPEEKLFPVVNELLDDWQAFYKPDHEGIRIIGFQWSPKSHKLKEFLSGNLIPFRWMDADTDMEVDQYLQSANSDRSALPLVILKDGTALIDPGIDDLASRVGLQQKATGTMYDVVIIGAGPAGLAASVYGSCEGLKTLLIEKSNPGGQASTSSRIENYLGFPTGLSGAELARRAMTQTLRFGTEILTPQDVKNIKVQDGYKIVELANGNEVHTQTIVIATGVAYSRLEIPGLENFNGAGVYYGSASIEAHACKDQLVYIVGGGNSACQAAMHISKFAKEVHILIRGEMLKQTAANYLVVNISKTPNITVHPHSEIIAVSGDNFLQGLSIKNTKSGEISEVEAKALFVYIGAKPGTGWLHETVIKDEKGFIKTGSELMKDKSFAAKWKPEREPYLCEASIPGIFASGDVRHAAMSGISAAVGEGSMAIRFVRKYLREG